MKRIYDCLYFGVSLVGNYLWIITVLLQWKGGASNLTFWLWWIWIVAYVAAVFLMVAVWDKRLPTPSWMKEDWEWAGSKEMTPEFVAWLKAKQRKVNWWWYVVFPFTSYFPGWWLLIIALCFLAIVFNPWIKWFLDGETFDVGFWLFGMILLVFLVISGVYANQDR